MANLPYTAGGSSTTGGWATAGVGNPTSAKGQKVTGYITNPAFDSRTGRRGAVDSMGNFIMQPGNTAVKRGYLMTDQTASDGKKYLLNFQFNPTSFEHSSQMLGEIPMLGTGDVEGANWLAFAAQTGQSVGFNLLFDRTYETWVYDKNKPASATGVLADIKTLYAMLGMYEAVTIENGSSGAVNPQSQPLTPASPIKAAPMWLVFGPLMTYYGLVSNVTVTFTHFTQRMIPVRAAVSIGFSVLPRGGSVLYTK